MSANDLLLWISARSQGSWAQFRAAVEELHVDDANEADGEADDAPDEFALPLYQALRFNLQRIGHAEFFSGASDGAEWRVTPPALAVTRTVSGWLGVVVGARTVTLLARLRGAAAATANLQTIAYPAYPDQLLIPTSDLGTLAEIAKRACLILQKDAPAALLTSLPPVDDPKVHHPAALPIGSDWKIDRFLPKELVWRSATIDQAAAASGDLFRFAFRHQRYVLFCRRGAALRIPGQVGKYLSLRRHRRQVLLYDRESRSLSVPASCRPPFLVERALILCSGSPPTYVGGGRGGVLKYSEISNDIASITAALLRQELR